MNGRIYSQSLTAQSAAAAGYVALEAPFPTTYSFTFQNTGTGPLTYTFINPSRCDPAKVSLTSNPATNAVGTVVVIP